MDVITEKYKTMLVGKGKEDSECLAINTTYPFGQENLHTETLKKISLSNLTCLGC